MDFIQQDDYDHAKTAAAVEKYKKDHSQKKGYVNTEAFEKSVDGKLFDRDEEIRLLKKDLDELSNMTVEEFTFKKKWEEIVELRHSLYETRGSEFKAKIWKPTDLNDEQLTIKEIEQL